MGRLSIPISDHNAIRRSAGVKAELASIAERIADQAGQLADDPGGYGTDMTVGSDRARAHVWPESGPALGSETKHAHLMKIVGDMGAR